MESTPKRIQRKRTKGWKMPENTVSVTRPGKWGNPFTGEDAAQKFRDALYDLRKCPPVAYERMKLIRDTHRDLTGKNLACWCKEGQPCHADALLELANRNF